MFFGEMKAPRFSGEAFVLGGWGGIDRVDRIDPVDYSRVSVERDGKLSVGDLFNESV